MELHGQTALVTGGTAGIGLESARLLAREGADVIITGRDVERGKKAVEDIHEAGSVRFVAADLSDLDSVAELVREAGPVDIIVNGAGSFPVAPTVEQGVASFERIFDTNVRGAYFLVAQLVPHMLERGRGSIINITSMAASKGIPGASVYSASKAALTSLTRTWAAEFGPSGVRVNAVSPGPTRTDGVLLEWGESIEDIAKTLPLGRTARAHEIAEAVLFLASPRTSYVTGSTIHVDAGSTAV
jgi:NAD(P)-dependent dehydrogenase (short-subunit alcohol dehydrogenase family)